MHSLLEVSNVSVSFGAHRALDSVNLVAERGHITGLIGPNGAGKSTLFDVICGLRRPGSGRVTLDGEDITRLGPAQRAQRGMARTFQGLELFGRLSVRDNLLVAAELRRTGGSAATLVDEVIDRAGLGSYADRLADSLPTGVGRLVEVARALATEPDLILLDEPAAGQDAEETERFARILRTVVETDDVAVLLVEHDMELVMGVCDEVHVLDLGSLITSGPPEVVRKNAAVLDAYLGTAS